MHVKFVTISCTSRTSGSKGKRIVNSNCILPFFSTIRSFYMTSAIYIVHKSEVIHIIRGSTRVQMRSVKEKGC